MQLPRMLGAYWRARRLRFASRAELEAHQARQMARFRQRVLARSPYFAPLLSLPMQDWPRMDKAVMMANFDRINTAGLRLEDVLACARQAEASRDFSPTLQGFSVGLSSGTSGGRGAFVVSRQEQAQWAGTLLARLLPRGLLAGERVALFLRANSNLYTAVRNPWLSFAFFDLFAPFEDHLARLEHYAPTIVVAPAQVLRSLALARQAGRTALRPARVVSVAEVLEAQDRALLANVFGEPGEVYQATEGFLGVTCAHGTLHLNEEFVHIEPEWLDESHERFVPIVTDFTRTTQPIVRYRLDDVLVRRADACPCGSPALALARIEGRCDDMLVLPGRLGEPVQVFADVLSRALAQALPLAADYRLRQTGGRTLSLYAEGGDAVHTACRARLETVLDGLGVAVADIAWHNDAAPPADFTTKRRRIVRLREATQGP